MLAESYSIKCKRGAAMHAESPGAELPPAHGGRKKLSSRYSAGTRWKCRQCRLWTVNRGRVCRKCVEFAAK